MLIGYKRGQTSIVLRVKILNSSVSTGAGLTGLTSASSGLIISTIADNEASATTYTVAGSTIESITTLGTYAAPTATKCRFKEVDATNHKGVYEIQLADARYGVSSAKSLLVSILGATNAAETDVVIPLRDLDPYDGVAGGLSRIDAAISSRSTYAGGAVASVTGNVGGNVVGSVASVVAAVATTSNVKKNQALSNFQFLMTDSTNHNPATGKTVTVTRAIDNGAQASGTLSAVTEIANGLYRVDFGAGDLNGNVITLRATATGCDDTFERIVTQP